jgi:hypothetical protein
MYFAKYQKLNNPAHKKLSSLIYPSLAPKKHYVPEKVKGEHNIILQMGKHETRH